MAKRQDNVPDLRTYYMQQFAGPGKQTEIDRNGSTVYRTHPMHLDDSERGLFDFWAVDMARTAGTEIRYYPLDKAASTRDPLYAEARILQYKGPLRMFSVVSEINTNQESKDEGYYSEITAQLWIPRAEVERVGAQPPLPGDIAEIWDVPYFAKYKTGRTPVANADPGAGMFFDVVGVKEDGFLADTSSFVGFDCSLRRVSNMPPERKLNSPKSEDAVCQ